MKVEGEAAKGWDAVRLDTLLPANLGTLTFADSDTGEVKWVDRTGTACSVTLGPHAISLHRRSVYRG